MEKIIILLYYSLYKNMFKSNYSQLYDIFENDKSLSVM